MPFYDPIFNQKIQIPNFNNDLIKILNHTFEDLGIIDEELQYL